MIKTILNSAFLLIFLLFAVENSRSQGIDGAKFMIEGKDVVLELKESLDVSIRDSILVSLGFSKTTGQVILNVGEKSAHGWTVKEKSADAYVLLKSMESIGNFGSGRELMHLENSANQSSTSARSLSHFGYNKVNVESIDELANGKSRFTLEGFKNAREVYLSGNFCDWSTLEHPMTWDGEKWRVEIDLPHGVWGYKFVVDGAWIEDPKTKENYDDGFRNINSKYVKANHDFNLPGHLEAKRVFLTGSFNDWEEKKIQMRKTKTGWTLPVYLKEGTWAYKYVLNGKDWILDPINPNLRVDGLDNVNSVVAIGDSVEFKLKNHLNAKNVFLVGSFNNWNENELPMIKSSQGWELPYVIGAGNFEYKFNVDGRWITDPNNPITIGEGDFINSVLSIEPNIEFELAGYDEASEVRLSGNFNGWANPGYTMIRDQNVWKISLHLLPGKYVYKFVVDGKYIEDPINPQRESNELGQHNSVLWIK